MLNTTSVVKMELTTETNVKFTFHMLYQCPVCWMDLKDNEK